ncbi:MAG: ABC transporter permease [Lachnospiraceae bacterium]|nr:ABC transporter permease [Lachnospiraceae bacterium]
MWFEILKKDLMKQKSVNIILFLFITLSTIFLASSVSNICVVMNGLKTYMDYANVSDVTVVLGGESEKEAFEAWIESRGEITEYASEQLCQIKADDIIPVKTEEGEEQAGPFETGGADLYLGYTGSQYAKPLDGEGNDLTLSPGEAALSRGLMERNKLQIGDKVQINLSDKIFVYQIAVQCKDIMFGNEMSGMGRFVFCREDYDKMMMDCTNATMAIYGINTTEPEKTLESLNQQGFETVANTYESSIYSLMYVFDMIVAALLIVIGICLILISLMILRFSLSFTLEENYREIGVMKAIGMRNFSIQKLYLVKYFAVVSAGALAGCFVSIPVGKFMTESVSKNMVLGDSAGSLGINLICGAVIIVFVTGMCVLFTGKLKKVSALDAIRNGGNGERYQRRRGLSLYKRRFMGTVVYLGLNDILCNMKRYLVLFLTFCISFVLITVPLNTLTTMESDEMASKFNLDPNAAVYIENVEAAREEPYHSTADLERALRRIESEMAEKGYDAELSVGALIFCSFILNDEGRTVKLLTYYPIGDNGSYCEYEEGEAPVLENELAFSKRIMEMYHLKIGDTVTTRLNGKEQKFIITGYYSDYMQLGESCRINPAVDLSNEISGYWKTNVVMDTDLTQRQMADRLKEEFPQYEWITAQEAVDDNIGSIKDTMRAMQIPMTVMLCVLIMLISLLMMKLFIVREKGQLAMLKSIGWRNQDIRMWLVMRMVWVVILSMIFAVPLSMLCNRFILRNIFAIMGAELQIQVDPLKAYVFYPAVLLAGIMTATFAATGSVRRIQTSDMKIAE